MAAEEKSVTEGERVGVAMDYIDEVGFSGALCMATVFERRRPAH